MRRSGGQVVAVLGFAALVVAGASAQLQYATRSGGPRLAVVARTTTVMQPKSVNVSPDGTRVITCSFGHPDSDNVAIYDGETLQPTGTISFPGNAVESTWSPDGRTLYVSNFRNDQLMVIDWPSGRVRGQVATGSDPKTIAVSPDGRTVYVANYGGAGVSVVDAQTLVELRRLPTGHQPRGIAVARDGRLFVASFRDNLLHEFAPGAERETRRIPMCRMPRHLALSPDDRRLYVTCTLHGVSWYDVATGRFEGRAPAGGNPRTLDLSGDGRWIVTSDFGWRRPAEGRSSTVSLIDTVGLTHGVFPVAGSSQNVGIAIRPRGRFRAYVVSWNTRELIALEPR
jgi:YVTN family beta-propeller protein